MFKKNIYKVKRVFQLKSQYMNLKKEAKKRFELNWNERLLCLNDNQDFTWFDKHYVYHTAWAARKLAILKPEIHYDISSDLKFSTLVSAFIPVKFFDYRPPNIQLNNLECSRADLLRLSFEDNSIKSLSCMHVVEHVGLGRYGDPLDYDGDIKAMKELARVLAKGGSLLFVAPIGKKAKIIFNAHRIYTHSMIIKQFYELGLRLEEFTLIPEGHKTGGIIKNPSFELLNRQNYACGNFWFIKK